MSKGRLVQGMSSRGRFQRVERHNRYPRGVRSLEPSVGFERAERVQLLKARNPYIG